jgi:amidase
VVAVFDAAVAELRAAGAETVDVELTDEDLGEDELEVLLHEFRPDLEAYLAGKTTLAEIIAYDEAHASVEMPWFGQELFEKAAAHPDDADVYAAAAARLQRVGPDRIDATLRAAGVVAIVAPTTGPAWPIDLVDGDAFTGGSTTVTAVCGYPAVTVPMGQVHGLPVGMTFLGTAWDEGRLLSLAYAYEQATHHAVPPTFVPSVGDGAAP